MRGATPCYYRLGERDAISIHAPRAGRDPDFLALRPREARISIHAPRAGRDYIEPGDNARYLHFNPRAPCGARLCASSAITMLQLFQSTRPVRGATVGFITRLAAAEFQSTRPVRGATAHRAQVVVELFISIHAPRAGRDPRSVSFPVARSYFNPRAPCGARLTGGMQTIPSARFQSTRPVRGATLPQQPCNYRSRISIHAPRAGRDLQPPCS